jgi:hypothetical protein
MILKPELGILVEVALKAGFSILARIEDELAGVSTLFDVTAPWPVT